MSYVLEDVRPKFELTKRNYVVTGGGQGIGLAVVRAIAEFGGNIAVLDIKEKPEPEFDTYAQKFGVRTAYFKTDVSKEEELTSSFDKAVEFLGGVDGLFTSAGIAIDKPFTEQTWQEAERIQHINVLGTFFAAQLAVKQMKKQGRGGSIVLVASVTSHSVLPGYRMAAYNASKGGVLMMSKALASEVGEWGIRVNTISPGFIASEQTAVVRALKNERESAFMDEAPPLRRMGTQNDLTGAVIYLLSDASAYTTGGDIAMTGGIHNGRIHM
ncbi:Enoyl-(Acyl carrier protein) reductase-like protein 42 [Elsinoe fawcettii]|nr:Enoyl-(Acyl carrier protein) reductase-like protein 42 [Elsinoe fawcettii]